MQLLKTAVSTSDMNTITFQPLCNGLPIIHKTSQRTGINETKAYPTIRICLLIVLTGDCLSRNAGNTKCVTAMRNALTGDKSQARKVREMTLNIQYGNGAAVVVRER